MTQHIHPTIANNREDGGRLVRESWIRSALTHPDPKPSWLIPWDELDEWNKEVDRRIWDDLVAPYIQAIDALHQRIQHAEYGEVYWQGKYDNLELQMKMDVWNRES